MSEGKSPPSGNLGPADAPSLSMGPQAAPNPARSHARAANPASALATTPGPYEEDLPREAPPTLFETVTLVNQPGSGASVLACVTRRTYSFSPTGKIEVADAQVPLTIEPILSDHPIDACAKLEDDTDLYAPKDATDIVFRGTAHARKKVRELFVAIALGKAVRRLRVTGERHAEVAPDGTVKLSPAELFERHAITPDTAYGGYDEFAQDRLAPPLQEHIYMLGHKPVGLFAYPRNSAGIGYFIDVERRRANGAKLPRIEDPSDALTAERFFVPVPEAWMDAPIAAQVGFLPHAAYPRFVRFFGDILPHLPPQRKIREIDLGCGADLESLSPLSQGEIHPRALQGACPGLAVERLRGDELCILQNLTPESEEVRVTLPGEAPRFALQVPDIKKVFSPKPILQTVRIDADKREISLTWCATVPILSRALQSFLDQCELGVEWGRL